MSDGASFTTDELEKPTDGFGIRHPGVGTSHFTSASPRAQAWWAFAVSLAITLVVAFLWGAHSFYYGDSASYWALGLSFLQHGSFALTNSKDPTWGYVFPVYDLLLHELSQTLGINPLTIIRVTNCLVVATLAAFALPRMAQIMWPNLLFNFWRRVVLALLLLVFWRGWINFSLTDFSGLLLLVTALSFLATSRSIAKYVLAGLFAALACDIRPSYLPVLIVMAMLIGRNSLAVRTARNGVGKGRRIVTVGGYRSGLCACAFVLGLVIASFPQAFVNHANYGTWSPVAGAPAKIDVFELGSGMIYQRFESVVIANTAEPIVYPDRSTGSLLQSLPGKKVTGYGQYVKIVFDHPLVMIGGYGRRLINGFDVHYSTPYAPSVIASPDWLDLASCTLFFLALVRLCNKKGRKLLGRMDWIYFAGLCLLCITALPVQVEPRFMLTGDVIAYVLMVAPGWKTMAFDTDLSGTMRLRWRGIFVTASAYVVWLAVWFGVIDATLASLRSP